MSEISRAIYDEYRRQKAAKRREEEIIDAVVNRVEGLVEGRIEAGLGKLREEENRIYTELSKDEMSDQEHERRYRKLSHQADTLGDFAKSLDLPVDAKGWVI